MSPSLSASKRPTSRFASCTPARESATIFGIIFGLSGPQLHTLHTDAWCLQICGRRIQFSSG
eukprot:2878075-Pyramimonas_sp.AAC.1